MHRRQSTLGRRYACRPTGSRVLTYLLSLFVGALLFLFPGISRAATPPGTQITNIVSAGYEASPLSLVRSNPTAVTVEGLNAVSIVPPSSETVFPGARATIPQTVANAGNVTDTIDLEGTSSLGLSIEFLASDGQTPLTDSNGNGNPDTGPLPPGVSVGIMLRITVPGNIATGQVDNTTITAISAGTPSVRSSVTILTTIPNFWDPLVKTVDPAGQVTPGTTVTYTNTFGNSGGAPATNVVITDVLETNLIFLDGSATLPSGIAGAAVSYDAATRTITWTLPAVPAGYAGQVGFRAMIDPTIVSDSAVTNRISIVNDQSPAPQVSNSVVNVVVEQPLRITKIADRNVAEIGDYVVYTVRVENTSTQLAADNVVISDDLPQGFRYVKESSKLDGAVIPDPAGGTRPRWPVGLLAPGESRTLVYRAVVSVDAMLGDGMNTARLQARTPGGNLLQAGPARVRIKVEEGALNSRAIILGRVFLDRNGDKMPGEDEPGVKDVRLYLEDGTYVITDEEGKFSLFGVRAGEHVLKLDRNSLPPGTVPVPLSNAFAGDGGSQFISVPFGGPARGDFGLVPAGGKESRPAENGEKAKGKIYTFGGSANSPPPPWEVQIQYMPPTPEILSPRNGASLGKAWSNIVVRVPEGTHHFLKINGEAIPQTRIGKKIHESARKIYVYEYIGVKLSPGPNTISLESIVPGGEGVEKAITVEAPGPPVKIVLDPPKATVPADGKSTVSFTITLLDRWNRPSMEETVVTVSAAKGTIVANDNAAAAPVQQVKVRDGQAQITLRSARETGRDRIKVSLGNVMEAEAEVFFTPELRDWVVAGIGSVTLGGKSVSGDTEKIGDRDEYKEGFFHAERLAVFAKGRLFDKYLLTGAYDTGKPEEEELFQRSAPDRYYPIYGDASTIGYDAESRRKLYLKVERDRSSVLFGDYHTALSENEFGRYDRTFNGLRADIDTGRFTIKAFAAETDQVQVKDEIPGNGTSGFYFLSKTPVLENSEKVRIEVRDRYHPERILSSVEKAPYVDYSLDYGIGTLLFKEPVPSLDGGLNPVRIVVLYEADGAGEKQYTYGGRAGLRLWGKLEVGATGIVEEKGIGNSTLFGADATLKLSEAFRLKGEIATSDTLEQGTGSAWKVELASNVNGKLALGAYYREVEETFRNLSMTGSEEGTVKYGVNATYRLREKTTLAAESFVQDDRLNRSTQFVNSVGVKQAFSRGTVEAGTKYLSEDRSGAGQEDRTSQIAYAGVTGNITKELTGALKREQVLTSGEVTDYPTRTTAELNYRISEIWMARLTQEIEEGKNRRNATMFGLENRVTENTTLSSRYQIEDTISGGRAQAVIGLNNKWEPKKGLVLSTKAERIQFVGGDDGSGGTALAFSAEYLRSEQVKATGRYELRLGERETTNLFSLGAAVKAADGLSFLPKVSFWNSRKDQGTDSLYDGQVGIAYRPKGERSIYLLDVLRFKFERANGSGAGNEKRSLISSTEASWRISPLWTVLAKYAGKYAWEKLEGESFRSYTDLLLAGATYDVTDRWDVGVQAKLMNQYVTGMHSIGAVVKTGYRVYRNLYAGIGYDLSRLNDSDLAGSSYRSHGPFLELKVKFDEDSLQGLRRPVEREAEPPPPVASHPPALPTDNVVVRSEKVDPAVLVQGSVGNFSLLVNGVSVPLPVSDVTMERKALYDVLEVQGGPLGEPVRFLPELAPAGDPKEWKLAVMNAQGEVVRALSGEGAPPGVIPWDGRMGDGREVNGGERYQYQLEVGYADGSRSTSARRFFGVNRSETIYLGLAVGAFRFDSAELSPRARTALKEVAAMLNRFPDGKVVVEGHTDSTGTAEHNIGLSTRRAEAAKAYLVEEGGIPAERFMLQSYGESMPVAGNDTAEGRTMNRRVELKGEIGKT